MCLNVEIRTLHEFYVPLMVRILTWISKFNSLIMAGKSVKDWLGSTNPDVRLLRISTINCKNTCMYNKSTPSLSLNYNPFFFLLHLRGLFVFIPVALLQGVTERRKEALL